MSVTIIIIIMIIIIIIISYQSLLLSSSTMCSTTFIIYYCYFRYPIPTKWILVCLPVLFSWSKKLVTPDSEVERAKQVFSWYDTEGNRFIQKEKLKDVLEKLNMCTDDDLWVSPLKGKAKWWFTWYDFWFGWSDKVFPSFFFILFICCLAYKMVSNIFFLMWLY